MKKAIITFAVVLFVMSITACGGGGGGGGGYIPPDNEKPPAGTPKVKFWASDIDTGDFYQVTAEQYYAGKKCTIWAEENSKMTVSAAKAIADKFDNVIRPKLITNFNVTIDGKDTLDAGDVDNDGKLCILFLDLGVPADGPYVAGYFYRPNLFPKNTFAGAPSNERDMVYMNVHLLGSAELEHTLYKTIAHETTHLMNYITEIELHGNINGMDTWVTEGFAGTAEWVYTGEFDQYHEHVLWMNFASSGIVVDGVTFDWGKINEGNNFFVWDNYKSDPDAIIDEYATVFCFFQWLRIHASNGVGIYKDIINDPNPDYLSVLNAAIARIDGTYATDGWGEGLLADWLITNSLAQTSGFYSYNGVQIAVPDAPSGSVPLWPGEGIIANTVNHSNPNIKFVQFSPTFKLFFNINPNNKDPSVSGSVTSVATAIKRPDINLSVVANSFRSRSRPISMQDMLRRNGQEHSRALNIGAASSDIRSLQKFPDKSGLSVDE